jgi:hypothetical protein
MATVPGPDPNKPPPIPGAPAQEPPREEPEPERYEPSPRRGDEPEPAWAPERWTPEKEEEEVGAPTPL